MKLFFTLFLFCTSLDASSQVMTSSCVPTPQLVSTYKYDVVKTATSRLFATNSTYKDSTAIPAVVKDSIANALYAVHNMPNSSLRDTIRNLFGFTNFNTGNGNFINEFDSTHIYSNVNNLYSFSPRRINLSVRDTTSWAIQWQAGNYNNTSNQNINQLVLRYGLTISGSSTFNSYINFVCTSNMGINMFGLSKAFNAIINPVTGRGAQPFYYVGDGSSIETAYDVDGINITYSNRCGDCPAGCQWGRKWTFKVYFSTCNVQYVGAQNEGSGSNPYDPNISIYTCTRGPVLPLTFGILTGYLQSGKPALTWKVLTQVNVREYVIERSDNGSQFYAFEKLPATASSSAEYNWKDAQMLSGTAWYRIKAVDIDGKQKYSSIVKLSNSSKGGGIIIYPNPVQNHQFTVQFASPLFGQVQTLLYDISGKQVWNTTVSVTPQTGSRTFILPSNLPSGTYSVIIQNETINYRQTLVISNK